MIKDTIQENSVALNSSPADQLLEPLPSEKPSIAYASRGYVYGSVASRSLYVASKAKNEEIQYNYDLKTNPPGYVYLEICTRIMEIERQLEVQEPFKNFSPIALLITLLCCCPCATLVQYTHDFNLAQRQNRLSVSPVEATSIEGLIVVLKSLYPDSARIKNPNTNPNTNSNTLFASTTNQDVYQAARQTIIAINNTLSEPGAVEKFRSFLYTLRSSVASAHGIALEEFNAEEVAVIIQQP